MREGGGEVSQNNFLQKLGASAREGERRVRMQRMQVAPFPRSSRYHYGFIFHVLVHMLLTFYTCTVHACDWMWSATCTCTYSTLLVYNTVSQVTSVL